MEPSLSTIKRLFALSNNRCAFPECSLPIVEDSGTVTGIVCHIAARSKGGPRYNPEKSEEERHAFENLILMCSRHSKVIDSEPKRFTVDLLRDIKNMRERDGSIELSQSEAQKAELLLSDYRSIYISAGGHVMLNSPGAVQAGRVTIKNQRKTVKILPPEGTIASDALRRNYIKHLIDRYNEFASQQPGRKFSYATIYTSIQREFGAKWDLIALDRFEELASLLQRRINRTMRGSMNQFKNYSTFPEYIRKYGSNPLA